MLTYCEEFGYELVAEYCSYTAADSMEWKESFCWERSRVHTSVGGDMMVEKLTTKVNIEPLDNHLSWCTCHSPNYYTEKCLERKGLE